MDLSQLSDEQLLALHKASQPDLSSLSDAQLVALHQAGAPQQAAPEPSMTDSLKRGAGLGTRDVVSGLMSIPNIIGNGVNASLNLGIRGINKMGANIPEFSMPSEATQNLMTRAGLPQPEEGPEQFASSINRAVVGMGPLVKGAQLAGQGVAKAVPMIRSLLANPLTEIGSAGVGAGASDITKQAGGGEVAQAIAGAVAPLGVTGLGAAANMTGRAVNEIRRPLTQGGAEQIAADALGRTAQDKATALRNLAQYNAGQELAHRTGIPIGVPGVSPTAGAVAADYGLIGGQQIASRGDAAPFFANIQAKNNAARVADLGRLNATDDVLAQYVTKRDAITAPLREKVFANSTAPVDLHPVADVIGSLVASPAGARAESQKALKWIFNRVDQYPEGRLPPEHAYSLYQDIGDLVAGKVKDDNGAALRLAGGLANTVKKVLGQQIEVAAPGFKNYLEHYARLSKPIDRLGVINDRLGGVGLDKVTNALPQVTPNGAAFTLSQDKLRRAVAGIKDETRLAPQQANYLERVLGDLNAETVASRGGKQPGSDTYQNLASANFTNRVLGESLANTGLGKVVQGPLSFASRPFESRIQDLIVQAYQDPKLMEKLLRQSRTTRASPTLAGLLDSSTQRSGGGLLGSLLQ